MNCLITSKRVIANSNFIVIIPKTVYYSSMDEENSPIIVADEDADELSECDQDPVEKIEKPLNMSEGAVKLRSWLNKPLRIEMTDKRVLVGIFLCTDRDANIILGSCSEYLPEEEVSVNEEPRMLGLIMVPGKHIVNISIDQFLEPSELDVVIV